MTVERFAPSPTGPLHLGHAYSAHQGWQAARAAGGRFLLRMEDLDTSRIRPEYYAGIEDDLRWLGLDWDGPVLRQSTRGSAYASALDRLAAMGLTYRCTCTRRDIQMALSAPQETAHGPDGPVYPGTCRDLHRPADGPHAIRLDTGRALDHLGGAADKLGYTELGQDAPTGGQRHRIDPAALRSRTGDIVLARRDGAIAYHLAVVVDDAVQGVTHVTRGADLAPATPIQRLLQALLGLPEPLYRHHALVRDETGRRLAKRDDARAIAVYRAEGLTPAEVLALARNGAAIPPA